MILSVRRITFCSIAMSLAITSAYAQTGTNPGVIWNWQGVPRLDLPTPSTPQVDQRCLSMDPPSAACIAQWKKQQQALNAHFNVLGSGAMGFSGQQCATKADIVDALKQVQSSVPERTRVIDRNVMYGAMSESHRRDYNNTVIVQNERIEFAKKGLRDAWTGMEVDNAYKQGKDALEVIRDCRLDQTKCR